MVTGLIIYKGGEKEYVEFSPEELENIKRSLAIIDARLIIRTKFI